MKSTKILFLFCYVIVFDICTVFAQQQTDSLKYYSDLTEKADNEFDSNRSFKFFERQIAKYADNNNILGEVYILTSIAQVQLNLGMVNESEGTAVEARQLLDKITYNINQDPYRISLYNHLGILYYENANFQTSLEYYEKTLELVKDSSDRITAVNNLANVYREKKDYETAIKLYKESLLESFAVNDSIKMARTFNNLGKTQSLTNDPEAIDNLRKGLLIRRKMNFDKGIVSSYISLGEHFKRNGDSSIALDYANLGLEISKTHNRIQERIAIFELQCGLGYFNNYNEFKKLKDSINNAKTLSTNLYAAIKYDKEKAINRANKNELDKEKEKTGKITFQALGLIILLSSIFLYFLLKSKHKKDKIKQIYLTETQFSKKVHDELANDVSDLMNYVDNYAVVSEEKKSVVLDKLEDVYLRSRDISTETGSINLTDYTKSLSDLLLQHNREGTKVVINDINTINWNKVPDHKKMIIYRCLQELMINMKKHSQAKLVSIIFKSSTNRNDIRYVDDGIGFSIDQTNLRGLQNVESRIKSIQGKFNFTTSTGKGFKATLQFNS